MEVALPKCGRAQPRDGQLCEAGTVAMSMALDVELRSQIMERLAARVAAAGGFLTRVELSDFEFGDGLRRRLMDTSRGIWNPQDLNATLSIVSSPDGPYDDHDVAGGLFRYAYRAGSGEGDNTKLRRARSLASRSSCYARSPAACMSPSSPYS